MLEQLISAAKKKRANTTIVVAHATHEFIFLAAKRAIEEKFASFIFVGPLSIMEQIKRGIQFPEELQDRLTLVDSDDEEASAKIAINLIRDSQGTILMKGMLTTSILLKAVLHREEGLRTEKIISHLAAFSIPARDKLLFLTDASMNILPNLSEKMEITQNAVDAIVEIGVNEPKVAALAAIEMVNPAMQATLDGAALAQMNKRGQITSCIVDGPLAFDVAVSPEAAKQKNLQSEVAGNADLLLVPSMEVGNMLYKSFTLFGNALVGGMIIGAKVPIILTSRADSLESKLFSMAMAASSLKTSL